MPSRENDLRASFERSSLTIVNQSKADGISPSVFKEVKTSTTGCGDNNDIEGGAIRAGGAPDLFSKDCIGLLVNYASVGLVLGMDCPAAAMVAVIVAAELPTINGMADPRGGGFMLSAADAMGRKWLILKSKPKQ